MAKRAAKTSTTASSPDDTQSVWRGEPAAVYGLEHPINCPGCAAEIGELHAIRMFRARVNFMSSLPRSGRLLVCPHCRTPVPAELYELFPVLKQMLGRRGGDLSGGQQQQLAIARALAAGPKLLILDEPTEGIQPSIIKDIGRVIRMLAERKTMAIVLVEQYYDFAAELADQYLVMERGEIVMRGRGADMARDGVRERMSI